ncbi:L-ascorbate peroxidase 3-like [Prosopis cineraria]|uniref:L-ascorbate peroxidase 3-like n=1 Tax=Prosopis cineraria TaxID=364024 RepID=UPI0024106A88|nr:L-ascorbate peroxidase 3-like [Prosopis cineraria]XP_054788094.1 L-ascorbate peroxidase 3-like [Prosopis cineraria]XP_054788096.1 L-ascorbate peroxidase 3-like [Prosopis cineraria]
MALLEADTEYLKEINRARRDHRALIASRPAGIALLLCFSLRTDDANTRTGGPNGFMRNEEEYSHASINGLKKAIDFCRK